uniref:Cyclin-like domain-containing protein n=1 Tax=Romanomermis culicivorax TaxID=13658 RepID=A0A915IQF5_ROMCU
MTGWFYDKRELKHTPSVKDGIDIDSEMKFRREGARLILDVGSDLNLRYDTVATGCVYFHRFFMYHSFKEFNRYVTAIGSLFLAGKVEETPKKCKDLLRVAKPRLTDSQFAAFGDDPKEEVMAIERVLLQTIKFDLQVDHPYQFLIKYAKILNGSKTGIENLVQMAWTFINDSLCTTICLQWEPEIVAIALMYLASRLSKCPINDWKNKKNIEGEKWWDQFVEDLSLPTLEDICHEVLDLYSASGATARPGAPQQNNLIGGLTRSVTQNGNSGGSASNSGQPSPVGFNTTTLAQPPLPPVPPTIAPPSAPLLVRRDSTKLPPTATVRGLALPTTGSALPPQPMPLTPLSQAPGGIPMQTQPTPLILIGSQPLPPPSPLHPNRYPLPLPPPQPQQTAPAMLHYPQRRSYSDNITLVDATMPQRYRGDMAGQVQHRLYNNNNVYGAPPFPPPQLPPPRGPSPYGRQNFNAFNNHTPTTPGSAYGRAYGRTYEQ